MILRALLSILLFCLASGYVAAESTAEMTDEQYAVWAKNIWDSLDRKTGTVPLAEAGVTLEVPENFYYLNAADAEKVLVEVWGNPPGQQVLGMLFPTELTPFDSNSWAVTIEYEEDGYVSDEDANEINYDDLLKEMKKDTAGASEQRVAQGYEPIQLVGWASKPYYDSATHKLHWAKEIKFGDQEVNTLNYNIRVLGRKGVLLLNFIAGIDQKETIDQNLASVLAVPSFDKGNQYGDFNPDIDKVAAYGIGALVAGKVIAKTGFLAAAIIFLKKFGIFIVLGIGAFFKKIFFGKKKES